MTAKIEFDLSEPDDREELERALKATSLAIALWDIQQALRNEMKYNEELTEDQYQILEKMMNKYNEILYENKVNHLLENL